MPITIAPLLPEQTAEARRVIYSVAYEIFHEQPTLEETIARYEQRWKLRDVDEFQQAYNENGGIFLAILDDGRIIGTGALRRLDAQMGEIKRLWLLPAYHGQGLGYRMMLCLIEQARRQGYQALRLETSRQQARAYAFYRRLGFYDIPRFGDDPDDVALELLLSQAHLPPAPAE